MQWITSFWNLFSRWCILAPLSSSATSNLYSRLHLALLESLLDTNTPHDNVVSAQHLASVVEPLLKLMQGKSACKVQLALDRLGQAVQVILESKSVYGNKRKSYCSSLFLSNWYQAVLIMLPHFLEDLFKQLDALPKNRLLNLVKAKHRTLWQVIVEGVSMQSSSHEIMWSWSTT